MATSLRILHLEDSPNDAELIEAALLAEGLSCAVRHVRNRQEFEAALSSESFDVILCDYTLPDYDGFAATNLARARQPQVPVIILSGSLGEEQAVDSLKNGATDYVLKRSLSRLAPAVRRAIAEAEDRIKRELAEDHVREQAMLLDKAQDAIHVRDQSNRIRYWNHGAHRLYGWSEQEAMGKNADELLCQEISPALSEASHQIARGADWVGELHQTTKEGKTVIVESRWTLVRDKDGRPKSTLVIDTDITEKKKLEAQFLRMQRMETIGALAGGIAHDLNNVLAPILMVAGLLHDELPTPESQKMLEMVRISAERGSGMVKQILSFARGVGGQHRALQLKHLVAEMGQLARDTFPRSIQIQTNVGPNLLPIKGDATHLHQVLMNLCVNARDAMPQGGKLTIEARNVTVESRKTFMKDMPVSGPYVVLSVSDTGHGIPPELLDKIYQPFFTTKELGKGTGLGLSTVLSIVKIHDGFVEVETEVGKGTTFSIYLPPAAAQPKADSDTSTTPPMGKGERILLVDDEVALLEITRETLTLFNYRVLTAQDGAEALRLFQENRGQISAVVTDMMMPVMDGPAMVTSIREIDPKTKVICVTGLGSAPGFGEAQNLQADACLQKPFSAGKLLLTLRHVLDASN